MRSVIIIFILIVFSFSSCDEPFNLNADWTDITIVYGVLNPADTAQYIKINKAFLGDGNAYEMAKEADSIQYAAELDVRLLEYKIIDTDGDPSFERNWERTNRNDIVLYRTNEIEKDTSGTFGTQLNYLYKTTEKLKILHKYVLEVKVPGKSEIVTAETFLMGELRSNYGIYTVYPIQVRDDVVHTERYLRPVSLEWESLIYGLIYEPVVRFHYLDIVGNDSTKRFIDISYSRQEVDNIRNPNEYEGELLTQPIGGEDFYFNVGRSIPELEGVRRKHLNLEFIFYAADESLSTYLKSSKSQGMNTGGPIFSNVINGEGIFANRFSVSLIRDIADKGVDSLAYGYYTKHLNFANIKGIWK